MPDIGWRDRASTIRWNTRSTPIRCPRCSRATAPKCWPAEAATRSWKGPHKFHRFVVVEFPTFDDAVACFTSAEYEAAVAHRRNGAGEVEITIVEGGDATPR